MPSEAGASRLQLVAAFGIIYFVWGSTFLAIRFAVDTLPPLLMAGVRFASAGLILYVALRARGAPAPTRAQWKEAAILGSLMFLVAHGALAWSETRIPSGLAALIVATVPLWMAIVDGLRRDGARPTPLTVVGLVAGFAGIALLVAPQGLGGVPVDRLAALVLVAGSLFWAIGSIRSARGSLPGSRVMAAAMQMLIGGLLLVPAGAIKGEFAGLELAAVTTRSWLSLLYLTAFGSVLAFPAYSWLLRHSSPSKVGTYAFVNPLVALVVGALVVAEPVNLRTVGAAALVLAAVALLLIQKARVARPPSETPTQPAGAVLTGR